MTEPYLLSLCSGYGGLDIAVTDVLGARLAAYSEIDPGASAVMALRYPEAPNLGDLTAADWSAYRGIDVVSAGFPCQGISDTGYRKGLTDARSAVWFSVLDAIREIRPAIAVLENVDSIRRRGLSTVLGGLAGIGYDCRWVCVRASDVGAPHKRQRWFAVAHRDGIRWHRGSRRQARRGDQPPDGGYSPAAWWGAHLSAIRHWESIVGRPAPAPTDIGRRGNPRLTPRFAEWMMGLPDGWVTAVPGLSRMAQIKILGNGVVPQQAEYALRKLI